MVKVKVLSGAKWPCTSVPRAPQTFPPPPPPPSAATLASSLSLCSHCLAFTLAVPLAWDATMAPTYFRESLGFQLQQPPREGVPSHQVCRDVPAAGWSPSDHSLEPAVFLLIYLLSLLPPLSFKVGVSVLLTAVPSELGQCPTPRRQSSNAGVWSVPQRC